MTTPTGGQQVKPEKYRTTVWIPHRRSDGVAFPQLLSWTRVECMRRISEAPPKSGLYPVKYQLERK